MLKLEFPENKKLTRIDLEYTIEQANHLKRWGIDIEAQAICSLVDEVMARGFGRNDHYWYLYKKRSGDKVHMWLQNWKRIPRRRIRKGLITLRKLKKEAETK